MPLTTAKAYSHTEAPSMVDYVLIDCTNWTQNKIVLGKKEAQKRLMHLEAEKRLLMKLPIKMG
jgi:hypothetical protein